MSREREAFGKPLSAVPGRVASRWPSCDTQVEAARLLCLQALWLQGRGRAAQRRGRDVQVVGAQAGLRRRSTSAC